MEGKLRKYLILSVVMLSGLSTASVMAQRKLPSKAYLTSAKINVIEGRPEDAIPMLDSLFLHYGPHSEGLELMSQIYVDYVTKASGAFEKAPYVEKMVAYFDSLRMCCGNEEIDKKYRKDCKKFIPQIDSSSVSFWREFYNKGLEQLTSVEEFTKEKSSTDDSAMIAFYDKTITAKSDSSIANMKLAVLIDSTDYRPYVAIGTVLEKQSKYEDAIEWLAKGLANTEDSSSLLLSVAYDYINLDKFCDAVTYFEHYNRLNPEDLPNANNLTICYIRCDQPDKAIAMYGKMLKVDSTHTEALLGLGQHYRVEASNKTKEAANLAGDGKDAEAKATREHANQLFDSAAFFYKIQISSHPEDPAGYEEFGLISYIRGRYEKAVEAFKTLTQLEPNKVDNWISLGDSHFNLKNFEETILAYEKAVQLDKERKVIWERLSDLYFETGKTDKKAKADKEVSRLTKN